MGLISFPGIQDRNHSVSPVNLSTHCREYVGQHHLLQSFLLLRSKCFRKFDLSTVLISNILKVKEAKSFIILQNLLGEKLLHYTY